MSDQCALGTAGEMEAQVLKNSLLSALPDIAVCAQFPDDETELMLTIISYRLLVTRAATLKRLTEPDTMMFGEERDVKVSVCAQIQMLKLGRSRQTICFPCTFLRTASGPRLMLI